MSVPIPTFVTKSHLLTCAKCRQLHIWPDAFPVRTTPVCGDCNSELRTWTNGDTAICVALGVFACLLGVIVFRGF